VRAAFGPDLFVDVPSDGETVFKPGVPCSDGVVVIRECRKYCKGRGVEDDTGGSTGVCGGVQSGGVVDFEA
jgi:hypothetical protein